MKEIIYTKFSNQRKKEYCILTRISEREGEKVVEKNPDSELAQKHVNRLLDNCQKLRGIYSDNVINIVPCYKNGNGGVNLKYIYGEGYDKYLSRLLEDNRFDAYLKEIARFAEIVRGAGESKKIEFQNENFQKVFGKIDFSDIKKIIWGSSISNIDMIFSNIIIDKENKLWLSDYEWVFDFAVPHNYIIYRSLLLDISYSKLAEEKKKEVLESLNIDEHERKLYEIMEKGFQGFVSGSNMLEEFLRTSSNACISTDEISIDNMKYFYTAYKVCENKEEIAASGRLILNNAKIKVHLSVNELLKVIPINRKGAIKINKLQADEEGKNISIVTNAFYEKDNKYYFEEVPPVMEIKSDRESDICLEYEVLPSSEFVINDLQMLAGDFIWHKESLEKYKTEYVGISAALEKYKTAYADTSAALDEYKAAYKKTSDALEEYKTAYSDAYEAYRKTDEIAKIYNDKATELNDAYKRLEEQFADYRNKSLWYYAKDKWARRKEK